MVVRGGKLSYAETVGVRDLMRHISGLSYGFFGTGLVKQAYRDARIGAEGDVSIAQFPERIAKLPLAYPPGST